jgi:hypothetical protein
MQDASIIGSAARRPAGSEGTSMFTTAVADDLRTALEADPDFARYGRFCRSTVRLDRDDEALLVTVTDGAVTCAAVGDGPEADIVLGAPAEAWDRLASPTEVNATLTRMLREGDLTIGGDVARAMHQWRSLFWIVARLRQVLSGVTEF